LGQGTRIKAGGLLARIRDTSNAVQEFRSPVDGAIGHLAVKEGDAVAVGQTIAWLTPDRSTVNDALQALAYVGTKDDLPAIESCAQTDAGAETAQQAAAAARAIKGRMN
jgi:pyruvate/2-oxoglutarate dehydrogenase complex dihydrolipoamide acyltransferase (E2) component